MPVLACPHNGFPLETIIDTDIKKMVEDRFNIETAKCVSTDLGAKKGEIMEAVKSYVVPYFKDYGITITVLGLKEDISYENPAIQDAIDKRFASEQDLEIQKNKNEANIAKAEAEAQAILIAAQAQAEANRLLSESLTNALLEKMYYEKWDGKLPYIYGGDGMTPIVNVP